MLQSLQDNLTSRILQKSNSCPQPLRAGALLLPSYAIIVAFLEVCDWRRADNIQGRQNGAAQLGNNRRVDLDLFNGSVVGWSQGGRTQQDSADELSLWRKDSSGVLESVDVSVKSPLRSGFDLRQLFGWNKAQDRWSEDR